MATGGDETTEKRFREFTERGQEMYEEHVHKYSQKLSSITAEINHYIEVVKSQEVSTYDIDQSKRILAELVKKYTELSDNFMSYLTRANTRESLRELSSHQLIRNMTIHKADVALKYADSKLAASPEINRHNEINLQNMSSRQLETFNVTTNVKTITQKPCDKASSVNEKKSQNSGSVKSNSSSIFNATKSRDGGS